MSNLHAYASIFIYIDSNLIVKELITIVMLINELITSKLNDPLEGEETSFDPIRTIISWELKTPLNVMSIKKLSLHLLFIIEEIMFMNIDTIDFTKIYDDTSNKSEIWRLKKLKTTNRKLKKPHQSRGTKPDLKKHPQKRGTKPKSQFI